MSCKKREKEEEREKEERKKDKEGAGRGRNGKKKKKKKGGKIHKKQMLHILRPASHELLSGERDIIQPTPKPQPHSAHVT